MKEGLTPDENYRAERDESSLGRRDYLRLTGAAGVVGLGSSAFVGRASASDTEPKRTLTIEGREVNAGFDFSVSGNVVKSTAMGASINSNDTISGQSVSGSVASGGRDSYSFSGELTSFSTNNDPLLYLNGEPLSDTVSIERNSGDEPVHYELRVDGEVLKSPGVFGTINASDEITPRDDPSDVEPMTDAEPLAGETYVLGKVGNGTDSYSISGDITGFHSDGNVNLRVNGTAVDNPAQFVRTTLTFERTDATKATYEFTTSEDVAKSRAMGATINDSDTIDGSSVTGKVTNGRDSYVFTGEITDFSGSDNLRVYMSRKEIDAATLSAEPEFENRLTIEGNGGYTVYNFAVEGNLAENYGVESSDRIDGKTANGFVQNDQDSYTFSGDLSMVDIDPNVDASFRTYLNGAEVDPTTLGNVQTTPDPEDLPNEVEIRALTDARTEYGFGVSGTLATGERSNTYSGDNASYEYARGWVSGGGLDNYKFSGEIRTLTDFETFQIDIDRNAQTISIEDFDSGGTTEYEITVSGDMSTTSSSQEGTVSYGTANGAIADGTDVYKFTGELASMNIDGVLATENVEYIRLQHDGGSNTEVDKSDEVSGVNIEHASSEDIIGATKSEFHHLTDGEEEELQNYRNQTQQQSEGNYQKSTQKTVSALASSPQVVEIGTDYGLSEIDRGSSGGSQAGITPDFSGATYNVDKNTATASIVSGPVGYGSAEKWAWVGQEFRVDGSGEQTATVVARGDYSGLLTSVLGATSSVNLSLKVRNLTDHYIQNTTIMSDDVGFLGRKAKRDEYNEGITVNLEAGKEYLALVKLKVRTDITATGEAGADFGPQDGDSRNSLTGDTPDGVRLDRIDIRF